MYTKDFYSNQSSGSLESAKKIVPYVCGLFSVRSVVDFGCGVGTWLNQFKEINDEVKVLGIDGDYVDKDSLLIDGESFMAADLEEDIVLPERFDLAMSLEVAEHLSAKRAKTFVRDITALSDVVLFCAATVGQGGGKSY